MRGIAKCHFPPFSKYKTYHILTLVMLNDLMYYTPPHFYPVNPQHSSCKHVHVFSMRVENSVDPDQMASSEAI